MSLPCPCPVSAAKSRLSAAGSTPVDVRCQFLQFAVLNASTLSELYIFVVNDVITAHTGLTGGRGFKCVLFLAWHNIQNPSHLSHIVMHACATAHKRFGFVETDNKKKHNKRTTCHKIAGPRSARLGWCVRNCAQQPQHGVRWRPCVTVSARVACSPERRRRRRRPQRVCRATLFPGGQAVAAGLRAMLMFY